MWVRRLLAFPNCLELCRLEEAPVGQCGVLLDMKVKGSFPGCTWLFSSLVTLSKLHNFLRPEDNKLRDCVCERETEREERECPFPPDDAPWVCSPVKSMVQDPQLKPGSCWDFCTPLHPGISHPALPVHWPSSTRLGTGYLAYSFKMLTVQLRERGPVIRSVRRHRAGAQLEKGKLFVIFRRQSLAAYPVAP